MGIENGEQPVHPGRVDAGPSHEREVVDLRHINTQALAFGVYGGQYIRGSCHGRGRIYAPREYKMDPSLRGL